MLRGSLVVPLVTGALLLSALACSSAEDETAGRKEVTGSTPESAADAGTNVNASDASPTPVDGDGGPSDAEGGGPSDGATATEGGGADAGPPAETKAVQTMTSACVAAPTDFGVYGAVTTYDRYELANAAWAGTSTPLPIQVFVPKGGAATHPVVFFSHPYGGTDYRRMLGLIEAMVSHDDIVVFTPYPTFQATVCGRYDTLWGGFQTAIDVLGARIGADTTRVGFFGHSFGGGATPWIAHQALKTRGWGANGAFLFASAPWYVYRMSAGDWSDFAPGVRLTTLVYADDTVNDHRMAIDEVWTPFPRTKGYVRLVSADHGACKLVADHGTPQCAAQYSTFDSLDTWGVWRQFQALEACTLRGDAAGCALAEGSGAAATSMGAWSSDATPVPPAERPASPTPSKAMTDYVFPFDKESQYPCGGTTGG